MVDRTRHILLYQVKLDFCIVKTLKLKLPRHVFMSYITACQVLAFICLTKNDHINPLIAVHVLLLGKCENMSSIGLGVAIS